MSEESNLITHFCCLHMVFDPTKKDSQRMCEEVDEEFPDSMVSLVTKFGQDMIKVEPLSGSGAQEQAEKIEQFLSDKGLDTTVVALSDDPDVYEVTATTEGWKSD